MSLIAPQMLHRTQTPPRSRARTARWAKSALLAASLFLPGCGDSTSGRSSGSGGKPAAAPEPADERLEAAAAWIREGRFPQAREALARVLADRPNFLRAVFLLALTYQKEKHYSTARVLFERVLASGAAAGPELQAHQFYGWCLYNLGRPGDARRAFERHLELVPGASDSHFALGLIEFDDGRLEAAEARFRRAIELDADNPARRKEVARARVRLADVYLMRDNLEKAKAELLLATQLWPAHYPAYHKLHGVLSRLGEHEAAAEALRLHALWKERARPGSETQDEE